MSIEEEVYYQPELWGDQPELPKHFPPVLFGCRRQYEAMDDEINPDTSEVSSYRKPKFQEDFDEGFI